MKTNHSAFINIGSDLNKAKQEAIKNCIDEPFFNIPLDQVRYY